MGGISQGVSASEDSMKWVEWIEPFGVHDEPVYMRVEAKVAAAKMQQVHPELTEEQALDEFIVVNWATVKEAP